MTKEEIIIKKIILEYLQLNNFLLIEKFVYKLKREGKFYKLKNILGSIIEDFYIKNNYEIGELDLVFLENEDLIKDKLSKIFEKILIKKINLNKKIILGYVLRTRNKEFNFSLENMLNKALNQNGRY
ncbi:MAG: hypothetical protein KatS3mg095_0790 [Candidatus Parcubacteria bacterium]|nr:MAG: hypothetical protein KatS3mg095_0790 [Candidatus Parcubacteria bacterium]